MKQSVRLFIGALLTAFTFFGVSGLAMAQDKGKDAKAAPAAKAAPTPKVILENEKVRIQETRYKPGTGGPMAERPGRATYTVRGGTFMRTYPDGKKLKVETKTGQWRWLEKETYSFENVGKTEIILNTVFLK